MLVICVIWFDSKCLTATSCLYCWNASSEEIVLLIMRNLLEK
jgi:hypothetical protein